MNPSTAPQAAPAPIAKVISRSEHTISRSHISANALRVLYRLREGGYQGFLVGGCVRDLLLGLEPKDFDVATDALPEQVKRLFRNCRLVGRRFRLAHVFFGREIIEVATFRAATAPSQGEEPLPEADPEEGETPEVEEEAEEEDDDVHRVVDDAGRILRDNLYGTIDADVWRRDFTANALYYNIADFSVWDYCGGVEDVAARRLRLIGDPETRYREDPVRMLRAARFEAKLGFEIEPATREPLERLAELILNVPSARLFEETLKLFLNGHGVRSLEVLRNHGLLAHLLPTVDQYLTAHPGSLVEKLLLQGLKNTDERVLADKPVTPTFLFALLFYGPIAQAIEQTPPERWHDLATILDACERAVREGQSHVAIPKRFTLGVREMFALQPRLEHPRGRRALRVLEHPRFRAAYDMLLLRSQFGLASSDIAEWWTRLQEVSAEERGKMVDALAGTSGPRPAGAAAAADGADAGGRPSRPDDGPVMLWRPAYVGIGSNLDEPASQVMRAIERLSALPRTRRILASRLFRSTPFGPIAQPEFVNAAVGLLTQLEPESLLRELRAVEAGMGRKRRERWGPRVIDLDLLVFSCEQRSGASLALPHPGIVERNFVLYPLAEIAPDLHVPGLGRVIELKGRVASAGIWPLD